MPILDHTIVAAADNQQAAAFVATILGLPPPVTLGPFALVQVGETTTLDFVTVEGPVESQHYAFLVTEAEFDEIFSRVGDRGVQHWADPFRKEPDRINTWDGGRGVYFDDPNGHLLEIITRSYGTGGTTTDHPHPLVAAAEANPTVTTTHREMERSSE
jgi:catechol 2,3-dioxygenase-like lactoylglutathione lyase family enzyme